MAKDTEEAAPDYSPRTGTDTDAGTFTYYDPATNTFKVKDTNPDDPFANKIGDNYIWGWTPEGDRVIMSRPEEGTYYSAEMGDNNWDVAIGQNPNPVPNPADNPYYNPYGGMNRDQPAPDPTPPALDRPQDSVGPGYEGVLPPDTSTRPQPVYQPPQPGTGSNTIERLPWGGGGSSGVDPVGGPSGALNSDNPLIGWDASTNKDFYQQQFKDMRDRSGSENQQALAASLRAQEIKDAGPAEATDPWAWAGGSEQFAPVVGGAPEGVDPNSWTLNPQYGWEQGTTNAQILGDLGGIFNTDEQAMLNKHQQNPNNNWNESTYWSSAPRDQVYDSMFGGANKQDPNWTNVLQKIYNNVWTQPGTAPTPGGMNVPAGYASPTNA